jgi:cytochrome P450
MDALPVVDEGDPAFWADVHHVLRRARDQHPIARTTTGEPLVLGYREVEQVLRDPRFATTDLLAASGLDDGPIHEWWSTVMFSTNPPQHTRLRGLVSRAFTPRRVEALLPVIEAIADDLLDAHVERGEIDLLHDYAHHLPIRVMSHLLAIPDGDYTTFATWTADLGLTFSAIVDPALRARLEESLRGLDAYVTDLIEVRRRHPGDDLLTALVQAEEDGDRLDRQELVAMVENLLFAGHDTTRSFLHIALPLLLEHPDEVARLRADPTRIDAAVEECLRYEPAVFGSGREPTEDVEIAGVTLRAHERVSVAIPAANRDPRVYDDPEAFRVDRFARDAAPRPASVLSFGQGLHHCLGAALARAEGRIGIARALQRLDGLTVTEPLRWVPYAHIRRYQRVPATFNPGPRPAGG